MKMWSRLNATAPSTKGPAVSSCAWKYPLNCMMSVPNISNSAFSTQRLSYHYCETCHIFCVFKPFIALNQARKQHLYWYSMYICQISQVPWCPMMSQNVLINWTDKRQRSINIDVHVALFADQIKVCKTQISTGTKWSLAKMLAF